MELPQPNMQSHQGLTSFSSPHLFLINAKSARKPDDDAGFIRSYGGKLSAGARCLFSDLILSTSHVHSLTSFRGEERRKKVTWRSTCRHAMTWHLACMSQTRVTTCSREGVNGIRTPSILKSRFSSVTCLLLSFLLFWEISPKVACSRWILSVFSVRTVNYSQTRVSPVIVFF